MHAGGHGVTLADFFPDVQDAESGDDIVPVSGQLREHMQGVGGVSRFSQNPSFPDDNGIGKILNPILTFCWMKD